MKHPKHRLTRREVQQMAFRCESSPSGEPFRSPPPLPPTLIDTIPHDVSPKIRDFMLRPGRRPVPGKSWKCTRSL